MSDAPQTQVLIAAGGPIGIDCCIVDPLLQSTRYVKAVDLQRLTRGGTHQGDSPGATFGPRVCE